ncbi:MAG: hypothetical protein OXF02_02615 [Simkaniaceae bacterium]|nr:hypothetical protein [Simkaniaceae bacterium]
MRKSQSRKKPENNKTGRVMGIAEKRHAGRRRYGSESRLSENRALRKR